MSITVAMGRNSNGSADCIREEDGPPRGTGTAHISLSASNFHHFRYYSMTPEERKEFNIRRYEKEKKRKADRKERNELEALLTASNDIQV